MRRIITITLACCLLALTACSSTFVYNQANWLIPWYLDGYVDLSRAQKKDLKEQLRPFLSWHRREELARYVVLLEQIERDLTEPLTGEVVAAWSAAAIEAWERIEQAALPLLFRLGNQLSAEQVAEFLQKLREEQTELEEKYLERSQREYVQDSFDNLSDNLSDFMGRLNSVQKERLLEAADNLRRFDSAWLEERATWQRNLEEVLQRQPGWEDRMRQLIAQRGQARSQQYTLAYDSNMQRINVALADVLNSRTPKQDRRLHKELRGLRRDLVTLIK